MIRLLLLREPMEPLLVVSALLAVLILGRRYLKSHQAPAIDEETHPISPAPSRRDSTRSDTPRGRPKPT